MRVSTLPEIKKKQIPLGCLPLISLNSRDRRQAVEWLPFAAELHFFVACTTTSSANNAAANSGLPPAKDIALEIDQSVVKDTSLAQMDRERTGSKSARRYFKYAITQMRSNYFLFHIIYNMILIIREIRKMALPNGKGQQNKLIQTSSLYSVKQAIVLQISDSYVLQILIFYI